MPPRVSLRRLSYVILFGCVLLLLAHFIAPTQKLSWINIPEAILPTQLQLQHQPVDSVSISPVLEAEDNNQVQQKAWFFSEGTLYPRNSEEMPPLFPEEDPGDRVVEQLMYVPSDYQGKV